MDIHSLPSYAREQTERLLQEIQDLVSIESPSQSRECVNRAVDFIHSRLETAGVRVTRVPQAAAGDQLVARWGSGATRTLLLGHLDTVWDQGQLERMPLRIESGKAYGPGIFDMKSGAVLMLELFRMAASGKFPFPSGLTGFFNSDEEVGSRSSRAALEETAAECDRVLVIEPCLPGGRAKTARKGVAAYRLEVTGRSAHAGVEPEKGVSAIEEFAHQALAIRGLASAVPGCTVNIGVVRGGTRINVVAERVEAEIDVRVETAEATRAVESGLRGLKPFLPGARLSISGGLNRPPLERSPGVIGLYQEAAAVAAEQGWSLPEGSTGGGSDGSFTAALGIPTLDGLGPDGDGAHALHEHILIDDLPRRLAMVAGLLMRLK